ncbi:MAG: type II toxin-antitoxin system VapC family toxin [Deltaproteobacteria bacterium]|nr:type II toxin-antitoxin system VapC family toxin [Deltaproteobacteria bacterium]
MILYLDTSALVKRYFREPYSNDILSRWKSATQLVTSFVTYAETMAAIYRKKREAELAETLIRKITQSFHLDWQSFIRVEVNDQLNGFIDRVIEGHPLRGFDAIHLASAMAIHERLPENFVFACFDSRLLQAARAQGLETFPPNVDAE